MTIVYNFIKINFNFVQFIEVYELFNFIFVSFFLLHLCDIFLFTFGLHLDHILHLWAIALDTIILNRILSYR